MTSPDEETISAAEAAKLLFVAKVHLERLIDNGTLPLHHGTGFERFVRKADVLAYKARKHAEARAFLSTQTEDSEPPGL
ncbi:helix-turn-helix domain-containing protein [Paraburkholderia nemoris]|uniref:helix-turn-helix transcriptional regulator n=1 Tax=Paraburkholderia nemoris TaxID=2793076 RepID=UPI0038B8D8F9